MARLRRANRVAWCGKGRKGDPYRYAALGTAPPQDPDDDSGARSDGSAEEIPDSRPFPSDSRPGTSNGVGGDSHFPSEPPIGGEDGNGIPPVDENGIPVRPAEHGRASTAAPTCPVCEGPTRQRGKAYLCAGHCADTAGPGGFVPMVAAVPCPAPAAPAEDEALFDNGPDPTERDTAGRRPDGRRR